MGYEMTLEDFFERNGYKMQTSVDEALAIKAKHPSASNHEIAKMSLLQRRQEYAAAGNWSMYSSTISPLADVYQVLGDNEQALEGYLQVFYTTLSAGREYTDLLLDLIARPAAEMGLDVPGVIEKYGEAVSMLPSALVPVSPSAFSDRLRGEIVEPLEDAIYELEDDDGDE